jgi:DNA-binding SARP family transcriptional activator/tetratricopeptide (TPR) repeat protein
MKAMEFKLLGPVEVVIEGTAVAIGASRQEIVLALLLLESNHVVSVARIIDALWGESPPKTARSQVQITVSALRQLLSEDVIVTRPPGYLMRVNDGSLDLERFRALVESVTLPSAGSRIPEAISTLRSALALWRGSALEGVDSEILRAAAIRLNEWRISVLQNCIDLELQVGRHAELIGELSELTAGYPINERFRGQLMLALYRAGRQADALETFRVGREILSGELGLDPGEDLCRLERAILTRDSQLTIPGHENIAGIPGKAASLPVPRQMPRTAADFTGRDEILSQIAAILSADDSADAAPEVPVVVITGRGGSGKTAVAVRAAHLLREKFPDGQLFLQLRSDAKQSSASLLEHLLLSVGSLPDALPGDLEGRAAMYRSWLAGRRVLIVIDGAVTANQVRHFLPGTPGCAVIITSMLRFSSLEGVHRIELGPLDDDSALRLLAKVAGAERVHAEEAAAKDLIGLCEGLPLALRVVAAKLAARRHWRIAHMVRQLVNEGRRLDELDLDGVSVRATLSISYDSLEADARRLFRLLSLVGTDDFAPWVGAPLLDVEIDTADDLLDKLVQSHLVETVVTEDDSVRFHLHDLVRIFSAERLANEEPAAERFSAMQRLLSCWLFLAATAHRLIYGGDFCVLHGAAEHWPLPADAVEGIVTSPGDWFRQERASLVTAVYRAGQLNLDELCWDLAVTSATLFESGFYGNDWRESHTAALDIVRRTGNRRGEAALLYSLGTLEISINMLNAATNFVESLSIFEEIGHDQGRALALTGLAFVDRLHGDYDSALASYTRAVAGFRSAGDLAGEAHILKTMAQIHTDMLRFDVAEQLLEQSLAICQKIGTDRLTAQARYEQAELHLRRDRLDRAVEAFESVLYLTHRLHDAIGEAYALTGLGNARRKLGDFAGSESALEAALELANNTDDRLIRGRILLALAELDYARERYNVSMVRIDEATRVLRELGSAGVWHARALELLGRVHERAGRTAVAEDAWRSAMELAGAADPALTGQLGEELARLPRRS